MPLTTILLICLGYLSGSVLYARVFAKVFHRDDLLAQSRDHNPGTANAFLYGGFWCGTCTLLFDVAKGFVPVFLYGRWCPFTPSAPLLSSLVLAAPVLGHIFPLFYRGKGGKGIAVTFGCLLGLYPILRPFALFAFCFVLFSSVCKISPHFYRTIASYLLALILLVLSPIPTAIPLGFLESTAAILIRFLTSKEKRGRLELQLLGRFPANPRHRRRA